MVQLIAYIQKEWEVIMSAPFSFIIILVLACTVSYIAARWRYGKTIELLKEKYTLSKESLAAKESQLKRIMEEVGSAGQGKIKIETNNAQSHSIRTELSMQIDRSLEKLNTFWEQYKKDRKDAWKYDGVVISTNPPETVPAEFKHLAPELQQEALKGYSPFSILRKEKAIEVKDFCNKIEDIVLLYKQLRTAGPQDFELTEQWETLLSEVIEKGNPLKPHNNRFHDDAQKNGRV